MTENLITQVSQDLGFSTPIRYDDDDLALDYNMTIHLSIRNRPFSVTRDELMGLPESILLCLFPNGVFLDEHGAVISNLSEDDVVFVNYDPDCFAYIINTFAAANRDLALAPVPSHTLLNDIKAKNQDNLLLLKPAIIDLREDLDFYVIPPVAGLDTDQMHSLKRAVADALLKNKLIFSGLGYSVTVPPVKLGPAEQHLFDMLCLSGFEADGTWGSRNLEPLRCVILSLLLVRLTNKSAETPPDSPSLNPVDSTASVQSQTQTQSRARSKNRISMLASSALRAASRSLSRSRKRNDQTQNKLLLFWRKPARKCWWSHQILELGSAEHPVFPSQTLPAQVKVHLRRVWTLELLVIGVQ